MGRPCSGPNFLGNANLFTTFLFTILVPLYSPPFPISKVMDFLLNLYFRTSNRLASTQNYGQTLPKVRTNRIMNRRAFLIFTKCCGISSLALGMFFSGPILCWKLLLSLEFGFWFGNALFFRMRSLVAIISRIVLQGQPQNAGFIQVLSAMYNDEFRRDFCEGDLEMLYFSKCFQVSSARSRKPKMFEGRPKNRDFARFFCK